MRRSCKNLRTTLGVIQLGNVEPSAQHLTGSWADYVAISPIHPVCTLSSNNVTTRIKKLCGDK